MFKDNTVFMPRKATTIDYSPSDYSVKLGFYAAILIALLTIGTFIVAYLTPPLSGPYCVGGCYDYPYTDSSSRFPRDYYWMYSAMLSFLVFAMLLVCIHLRARQDRKVFSVLGLIFGLFGSAVLIVDFFVQVSVIPQSLSKGENEGIALISQFNPHGLFIILEELGYILIAFSFLAFAPTFPGRGLQKAIRYTLIISFLTTAIFFCYYTLVYGSQREYRFEVASISICWLTMIVSGSLLAVDFRQRKSLIILKPADMLSPRQS
jgi:hypothetical protein